MVRFVDPVAGSRLPIRELIRRVRLARAGRLLHLTEARDPVDELLLGAEPEPSERFVQRSGITPRRPGGRREASAPGPSGRKACAGALDLVDRDLDPHPATPLRIGESLGRSRRSGPGWRIETTGRDDPLSWVSSSAVGPRYAGRAVFASPKVTIFRPRSAEPASASGRRPRMRSGRWTWWTGRPRAVAASGAGIPIRRRRRPTPAGAARAPRSCRARRPPGRRSTPR